MRPRDYALRLRNRFTRRAVLVGAAQTGLFGLLLWRLRRLQILEAPEYQLLSDDNRISEHLVAPARGALYDRVGRTIAEDRENFRVMVIPALCRDLSATLDAISEIVAVGPAAKDRVMRAARRQSGYFPVLVTEGLDWRQFALLSVLAPQIAGMRTDRATYRRYVRARSMAHVVGYVGLADKEEVGAHPVMRVPGFRTGKAGIEKGLDAELRGEPGTISYEVDAHGRVVRELGATPSVRGKDLVLTIDQELQEIAHKRIQDLRVASIVVLDALTGGIVVMASYPSFDPNEVSFKVDLAQWKELARNVDHPLENRALRGQYPPGSTFKVVTALAGLEAGVITPEERMTCPGGFLFGRHYFRCWKRHGTVALHEAIKQSCDVYFYHTVNRVGIDRLAEMSRKLGLGQIHDVGLAGQKQGIIPDTKWKRRNARAALVPRRDHQLRDRPGLCLDHATSACGDRRAHRHGQGGPPALDNPRNAGARARVAQHRPRASRARARRHGRRREREGRDGGALGADPSQRANGGKDRHLPGHQRQESRLPQGLVRGDPRALHRLRAGREPPLRRGLRRRAWRRRIARGGARRARRHDRGSVARSRAQDGVACEQ